MLDFEEKRKALNDPDGRFMVWAHRGESVHYPENSIEGIISACMMGVDVCEIDVSFSKDDVPVLMHDDTLTRTTNFSVMKGKTVNGIILPTSEDVSEWTLTELRCLRLKEGTGGANAAVTEYLIPTLEEAVIVANGRMFLLCDKLDTEYTTNTGFTRNDVVNIAFPIFERYEAWDTMIYNAGMGVIVGNNCRKLLLDKTENRMLIPYYQAIFSNEACSDGVTKAEQLESFNMPMLARISVSGSGFVSSDEVGIFLNEQNDSLAKIKSKMRLYADCYKCTEEDVFKLLNENGINGAMVNDPLSACKFVAQTYYND
ncbi:MAG: glycerophosphodiester phosphodiesterase family protein [Clostridia bacterium]|nr:glycerophosphodiester phosphodiesterase family protein [Clostridia bacterium]MBR4014420.1 glycerophosphodiester phosphodiesterase family protein [Clostridia bacterium]